MGFNAKCSRIEHSNQDESVNFIWEDNNGGFLEARYVRRASDHYIVYLSSQGGCAKACKMCHLTQTGQFNGDWATKKDYLNQAKEVLEYAKTQPAAKYIHYNFMARGDALANPHLLEEGSEILEELYELARSYGVHSKMKISTIFPEEMLNKDLSQVFSGPVLPDIYYSIYSTSNDFRKKWLPKAIPVMDAVKKLKSWQDMTNKVPYIHHALINEENDSVMDAENVVNSLGGLKFNFNSVAYNSANSRTGEESTQERQEKYLQIIASSPGLVRAQKISRVGFDVKASCGMFINGQSSRPIMPRKDVFLGLPKNID